MMNIFEEACRELADEAFREAVNREKERIRREAARRPLWHRLFPFTITFKWRD